MRRGGQRDNVTIGVGKIIIRGTPPKAATKSISRKRGLFWEVILIGIAQFKLEIPSLISNISWVKHGQTWVGKKMCSSIHCNRNYECYASLDTHLSFLSSEQAISPIP